ncbi:MAG: tol-pal system protein YbgF [Acidobacteria bacterium]|nr:tol-pal system protein YbgF [Acidobacteriota bacterium]MBV9478629.1 tol-pal system protein YbgF [Acidobacteriota bacterium]
MRLLSRIVPAVLALGTFACVSTSDFQQVQSQVAELQEQLASVKRTASSKEEVQGVNQRIAEQTETLLKSNATLVAKVDEIDEHVQNMQGAIEQGGYRNDRLAQQLTQAQHDIETLRAQLAAMQAAPPAAASAGTTAPTAGTAAMSEVTVPAPVTPAADPMQTYQAAYRDYQRGNYDLAIEGFRDFLAANANSELADNASYWIGESLYSQKKYQEAIEQFDSVVNKYPRSDKVPGALLKKGYAYIALGQKAQGIVQLQYVVHEHPKSQEAPLARQKLKALGIDTK